MFLWCHASVSRLKHSKPTHATEGKVSSVLGSPDLHVRSPEFSHISIIPLSIFSSNFGRIWMSQLWTFKWKPMSVYSSLFDLAWVSVDSETSSTSRHLWDFYLVHLSGELSLLPAWFCKINVWIRSRCCCNWSVNVKNKYLTNVQTPFKASNKMSHFHLKKNPNKNPETVKSVTLTFIKGSKSFSRLFNTLILS